MPPFLVRLLVNDIPTVITYTSNARYAPVLRMMGCKRVAPATRLPWHLPGHPPSEGFRIRSPGPHDQVVQTGLADQSYVGISGGCQSVPNRHCLFFILLKMPNGYPRATETKNLSHLLGNEPRLIDAVVDDDRVDVVPPAS